MFDSNNYHHSKIPYLALLVFLLMAAVSQGFYHPDEQYFAIDFAAQKLGTFSISPSWEALAEIRPWSLPALFFVFFKIFHFFGVNNPFSMATGLRLISALYAWFCLYAFSNSLRGEFKKKKDFDLFLIFLYFSFFIVFMSVRTSSDNWAASTFLLGLSFIFRQQIVVAALLWGLAFNFRHQTGILIFSASLWLLYAKYIPTKSWFLKLMPSMFSAIGLGLIIDCLGYGHFTLTPWNYLYQNLILHKMQSFGVTPFWEYFKLILLQLTPFWGIPLILTSFIFIIKRLKHFATWLLVPFFLFHCMLGHKELRFLYPLAPLAIFILCQTLNANFKKLILIPNFIILVFLLSKPAYPPILFYKEVWERFHKSKELVLIKALPDEHNLYPSLEMPFYIPSQVRISTEGESPYFFSNRYFQLVEQQKKDCKVLYSTYPSWLTEKEYLNFFNWMSRSNIWSLFYCPSSVSDKETITSKKS